MVPEIKTLPERKLVGKHLRMSLASNKTGQLWQSFMGCGKEITNTVGADLYSLQTYDSSYFDHFDPAAEFEKWAAIEVSSYENIPEGMEAFTLPAGMYAVFNHTGGPETGPATFQYIFATWLPNSVYSLDNRPHFELLGPKYKNYDPGSEEEIWIPIKVRN